MTEETAGSGDVAGAAQGPRECMPCRGSGKVISNLGGSASDVTCPWCEGSGVRTPGIDAQARWNARAGDGAPDDGADADAGAPASSTVGTADERPGAGAGDAGAAAAGF